MSRKWEYVAQTAAFNIVVQAKKLYTMKELEERLREKQRSGWVRPQRAYIHLDDALAIVADVPRIYRGEEIKDAPDGLYAFPSLFKPRSVLVWRLDEVVGMMNAEPTAYPWAFGPLPDWLVFDIPTNSPSEGIRATPDLPDSIHRNQGKG